MYHRWWFIIHAIYLIGLMWSHINYYYIELFIVCANQYQSIAFCLCVTMMANRLWTLYIKYYARVIVSQPHTPRGKPGPSWSCAQCICSIMLKIVNRVFHFDSDKENATARRGFTFDDRRNSDMLSCQLTNDGWQYKFVLQSWKISRDSWGSQQSHESQSTMTTPTEAQADK